MCVVVVVVGGAVGPQRSKPRHCFLLTAGWAFPFEKTRKRTQVESPFKVKVIQFFVLYVCLPAQEA